VQVVHTNPREVGHFVVGEDFLTGFDGNHGLGPLSSPPLLPLPVRCLMSSYGCTFVRAIVVPLGTRKTNRLVLCA
jgi:hypothetical protein